jgi:serine/threonine protein kinase
VERAIFFDRLRQNRLLSDAELERAASRFGDDTPPRSIAEALVAEGVLTPFQVRHVSSGDTQPLSLGQYRLLDELGRGGMGRVYKALHTFMDRVVAIKVISPELVKDPIAVEWFRREVRASTQLVHPNIVMAYDANEAEGLHFLVMEYVHGVTLDALVKQHGPLPISHACAVMRQAALALQYAHDKSMVHRDIKPGNLFIPLPESEQPSEVLVKILDFGLARLQGKTQGETIALRGETGVLGTPDYIAPEQSRDIHSADIRSDLYSLGCSFYFALAGRVPFPGDNAMEKLLNHLMEQAEPIEKLCPDVPPEVAVLVRRLMAKDPAERPQTPAELAKALEGWAAEQPRLVPALQTPNRPLWLPPPTQLPSAGRPTPEAAPEHTCVLDNVQIFAPSQQAFESSGPSMLEPLCDLPPMESRRPDTHDTLSFSRAEDTEEVAKNALSGRKAAVDRVDSDATQQDLFAPSAPSTDSTTPLPPLDPVVSRLWQRWTDLVQSLITGCGASRLNADNYRTIHALLLQACRGAIDACSIPERRAFYEECLSIAQPWLNLQSFVRTEPMMLESLLQRCKQIEIELNGGSPPWTIRQCLDLMLLILSPLAAALWYWHSGRVLLPSLFRVLDFQLPLSSMRSAWDYVQTHPSLLMGAIFPLVFIFSIALLWRTPRI